MASTHTKFNRYTADVILGESDSAVSGDGEVRFDGSIAGGGSPVEIDLAFPFAKVKSFAAYADGAVTLKTNSSSSPADTLTIPGGLTAWNQNDSFSANVPTCPFTVDVTKVYAVNAGSVAVNLKLRLLLDVTP